MESLWECVQPHGKTLDRSVDCWWVSYDGENVFRWGVGSAQQGINMGKVVWVMPSATPKGPVASAEQAIAKAMEDESRTEKFSAFGVECMMLGIQKMLDHKDAGGDGWWDGWDQAVAGHQHVVKEMIRSDDEGGLNG